MKNAASKVVPAKTSLSLSGSVFNDNLPPIKPPIKATKATGRAHSGLKSPRRAGPINPEAAVAAIIAEEVPIAILMRAPASSHLIPSIFF
jgi:hypothetical protein